MLPGSDVQATRDVALRWTDATGLRSRTLTILRRTASGAWVIARAMGAIEAQPGEAS